MCVTKNEVELSHNCLALQVARALQKDVGYKSDSAIKKLTGSEAVPWKKNCCTAVILRLVHHDTTVALPTH